MAGIFKAYDIRGTYPDQIDAAAAKKIGAAMATLIDGRRFIVGHDMRPGGDELAAAMAEGVASTGADVMDIGTCSTPMSYFAVGYSGYDGVAMITASHNPAGYNGVKISRAGAVPVAYDTGGAEIERLFHSGAFKKSARAGKIGKKDVLGDYVGYVKGFLKDPRPMKIVVDAGNGMAGLELPPVFAGTPIEIVPLFFELDGTFPNHEANPLKAENMRDLIAGVRATGADFGAAFDGDGDRCMFVDERAEIISCDKLTCLIAQEILGDRPGEHILYDLRSSWTTPEVIRAAGGVPGRVRVGHSFIKAAMREVNAAFAGELSGHYYFRDNYFADSGVLALIKLINLVSAKGRKVSELVAPFARYFATGEINYEVADKDAILERLKTEFADGKQDELDGLTVEFADWWFNVRPSNTEPVLRLNLEARTAGLRDEKKAVLGAILGA